MLLSMVIVWTDYKPVPLSGTAVSNCTAVNSYVLIVSSEYVLDKYQMCEKLCCFGKKSFHELSLFSYIVESLVLWHNMSTICHSFYFMSNNHQNNFEAAHSNDEALYFLKSYVLLL